MSIMALKQPKLGHRRPFLGATRLMDSDLLDLPLGVKIHVKPKSKTVFCRGKLGETLIRPCPSFNLDDPYSHNPAPPVQYNCLHDPHLRDYHKRKDILQLLKRQGVITSDNKVVCTLKEFNEYRHYLTRLKLQLEKILKQQEEGLLPFQAKLKDGPKLPETSDTSCQGMQQPQPQKPTCPCPQKSEETPLKSGRLRRGKIASDEGQTYSRAELGTAADSQRKLHNTAHGLFKAVLEQLTAAEAQKLQELVEAVVHEVFGRLRVPRDYYVNFLRRAARKIRGIVFSSCVKTETPQDHRQEMEMLAKELVATVLESLGDHLESKASEPRRAAKRKEQPVDARATLVDKSKEAEAASSDTAHLHTCLDKLTRQVVKNVRCLLKSMVASQFEGDSSYEYTKILELPKDKVSNRQMQPGISGACEGQSQEASTGVKLPALGPRLQEKGNGYAKTTEPENPAMVKEMVIETNPATSGNTLDIRTMANRIVQSLLDQIGQHGRASTPRQNFQGPVPNPATSQGGEESCAPEDTLPSVDPQFFQQPIPLEGPKLPAQTGARRRSVNPKLV